MVYQILLLPSNGAPNLVITFEWCTEFGYYLQIVHRIWLLPSNGAPNLVITFKLCTEFGYYLQIVHLIWLLPSNDTPNLLFYYQRILWNYYKADVNKFLHCYFLKLMIYFSHKNANIIGHLLSYFYSTFYKWIMKHISIQDTFPLSYLWPLQIVRICVETRWNCLFPLWYDRWCSQYRYRSLI